jgi:site-specific DNA-methyltransferase (adenine-specific)
VGSAAIVEVLEGRRAWHVERGNALQVLTTLPDASVDAVIADHPYASGGLHMRDRAKSPLLKYPDRDAKRRYIDFEGDQCDQYAFLTRTVMWLSECLRAMKPGALIAVFADWRQAPITSLALQIAGFRWRGTVSWDKTQAVRPNPGFRAQVEFLQWGTKGAPAWTGKGSCQPGSFTVPVLHKEKVHVTGKPVELMRRLVRVSKPGGVVLDPFAGSGSTGVGCLLEGYRFLGIEIVEAYASIAFDRLRATEAELQRGSEA